MFDITSTTLGTTIVILGLALLLLTPLLLRLVPRLRSATKKTSVSNPLRPDLPANENAVLIIKPGGRIIYINPEARSLFGVLENETPNIERMARRVRPAETFIGLCASAGQSRFTIQATLVEAVSYSMPYDGEEAILVTLERPQLTNLSGDQDGASAQAINIFTDISKKMTSSLDLETTIQSILENVDQLIPSDFSEITIWDGETQELTPYRYLISIDGERVLEKISEHYKDGEGLSGLVISRNKPLIVEDIHTFQEVRPAVDKGRFPFRAYLGIPLNYGSERIGTLELTSQTTSAFKQGDLEVLEVLSGQAAVAIQNSIIHHKEQLRSTELAGLAKLAQLSNSIYQIDELYTKLISSIQPLLQMEMVGLLIYDPVEGILSAKKPFAGMPNEMVEIYQTKIKEGSPAEKIWNEQDVIITDDVTNNPLLKQLGLSEHADTAGMRETAMLPLSTGGNSIGYLQVANKPSGTQIDDADLRLLTVIAGQVGPILENAFLVADSRRRTQRAESLRRVASLAGSTATSDEILKFSMLEFNNLMRADIGAVLLLEENSDRLILHKESVIGINPNALGQLNLLSVNHSSIGESVTVSTKPILINEKTEFDKLPEIYRNLHERFTEINTFLIMPLIIRDRGIGEIIIGSKLHDDYDNNDIQSMESVASQLANAIDRSSLSSQTDESLQIQVDQLSALNRVSRELNSTQNLNHLLRRTHAEVLLASKADNGSVLLFDLESEESFPNNIAFKYGYEFGPELNILHQAAVVRNEAIIVADFNKSEQKPSYPGVQSEMVIPIRLNEQIAGLIHLHSKQANFFRKEQEEDITSIAVQAAIAFNNVRRYQSQVERGDLMDRRMAALNKLVHTSQEIKMDMPLDESLTFIANGIQESELFEVVLIYLLDQSSQELTLSAASGLPENIIAETKELSFSFENISQLISPEYLRGKSYFVPYTDLDEVETIVPDYAVFSYTVPLDTDRSWQPGDRLLIPLVTSEDQTVGMLGVDAPQNGLRPDDFTIDTLEIFANQAAQIIEDHATLNILKNEVSTFEFEQELTEQGGNPSKSYLSTLLKKDLEQTISIHKLHDRARNVRIGLDIAEQVNRQPDRDSVLSSLANQLLIQMGLDSTLIAEPTGGGPRLLQELGSIPEGINTQSLLGQRNPLRTTIQTGKAIFVPNLENDMEWQNTPLLRNLNAKGFISLPIASNGTVDAALLAISQSPIPNFSKEDEQIYDLIGNQVSITLQNLDLLTETRRRLREVNLLLEFSRQLGTLDLNEILTILVNSIRKVMSNAHGAMVSLWNIDNEALHTHAASGYTDNDKIKKISYALGEALPGQVFKEGIPLRVDEVDFARDYSLSQENLLRYREATGGRVPISSLLVPIMTGNTTLGVITIDNFNTTNAFTEDDQALVTSLALQTALTLENARLFEEARISNEELEERVAERTDALEREHRFSQTLLTISGELSTSLDLDMVLNQSLGRLNEAIGAEHSTIVIRRPGEEYLIYRAGTGIHDSPPVGGRASTLKAGEGLAGWVLEHREAVVITDLMLDQRWMQDVSQTSVYRSAIAVPLIVGSDSLGSLMLFHREVNKFSESQVNAIQAAGNQFALTINNGELFELIRDQAEDLGVMLRAQQIESSRSRAMLEGVADGVLVTDNEGLITLFNESAEKVLELSSDNILGKNIEDFSGLFGSAAESWMKAIQSWSSGKQELGEMHSERLVLEDGRVVSVHLASVSSDNEFLGTVSIFRDITHQVEVDRLKSEFVATVSHELRTPMTPIKGYVEFLLMGGAGDLNEQQNEYLDIIKVNVDRLSILVNDLLDVSRIEAGKVALSFQPTNIEEIIQDTVEEVQRKSGEENKSIDVEINIPEMLPNVFGDVERIRQIMTNLLDNAYRYSSSGSTIRVSVQQVNSDLQIDIVDSGVGIFPDEQERIFDRFYRGENHLVLASAGTGLGLPIVKELVEMHNGRIWVESSGIPDEGSTFSITLPIYEREKETNTSTN